VLLLLKRDGVCNGCVGPHPDEQRSSSPQRTAKHPWNLPALPVQGLSLLRGAASAGVRLRRRRWRRGTAPGSTSCRPWPDSFLHTKSTALSLLAQALWMNIEQQEGLVADRNRCAGPRGRPVDCE